MIEEEALPDLVGVGAKELVANASRLGLSWRLVTATVTGTSPPRFRLDGDTAEVEAVSMIGSLLIGQRIYVALIPPGGMYAIGYVGNAPGDLIARVDGIANSASVTAETVVLTLPRARLRGGSAYRFAFEGRLDNTAAATISIRYRRNGLTGTQVAFLGGQTSGADVNMYHDEFYVKANSDLIDDFVMTIACTAGTIRLRGAADTVHYLEIRYAGPATAFENAFQL